MKKILAMMLTAAMMLSMSAAVMADNANLDNPKGPYTDEATVTVKKTYKLENEGMTSPAETFEFSDLTCTTVTNAADGVTAANAPLPTIGDVSYTAGEATKAGAVKEVVITLPDTIDEGETIEPDAETGRYEKYPSVGVYTYTFYEIDGKTAGVTYREEEDVITLVVTVVETDGKLRVASIHTEDTTDATQKKSDNFENIYSAGKLEVKKTVTGNLGDKSKEFTVKVTFKAPEGKTVKEAIKYTDGTDEKTISVEAMADGTETVEIVLVHDETVIFTNIPYGVTYTVEENDYTKDADGNKDYDAAKYDDNKSGTIGAETVSTTIINNKETGVDTGISVDSIPYIAMLGVVAVGGAGVVVSKKRRSED